MAMTFCLTLNAQYYSPGRSAYNIKWRTREFNSGKFIYPDYFEKGAARFTMMYDSLTESINYGMSLPAMSMPVVVHAENVSSNGLVILAPNRSELLSIPDIDNFATEWYAHLVAHEYRHAVQYANLSAHFFKPLSWFIGQQSDLISIGMVPLWFLEGDAVMAETQASDFGRALQPSFTMAYRAYLDGEMPDFSRDKWYTGSYRDYIPDHYSLGYQLVRYSRNQYGVDMWDKIMDYTSRYPYTIFARKIAMKKYYSTSTDDLLDRTMLEMQSYWAQLPVRENSAQQVVETPHRDFTKYKSPVIINDSTVYIVKESYDRASRIVSLDTRDSSEDVVANIGVLYTPPSMYGSKLLWSEVRQSLFWEQKNTTKICYYDLNEGNKGTISTPEPNPMFPVIIDDMLAYFAYDYSGVFSLVIGKRSMPLKGVSSVHGLAYDDRTATLVAIILQAQGMSIVEIDVNDGAINYITQPSRTTVSELRAAHGVLTFSSIASGYDEVHTLDLASGIERRLTTSRYGSFSPSAISDSGRVYLTSYSTDGYLLGYQDVDNAKDSVVGYSYLPQNVVNLKAVKLEIVNIDSLSMSIEKALETTSEQTLESQSRPYSKAAHMINIHSWMPLGFNPYDIVDESSFDFALGLTLLNQNILGTLVGSASYRYTDAGHLGSAKIDYEGLPVKFELEAEYGGEQLYYGYVLDGSGLEAPGTNFSASLMAYLPMTISSDYHTRTLTPVAEYSYINAKGYLGSSTPVSDYIGQMGLALYYSDYVRMAYRDILPRWGYNLKLSRVSSPNMDIFSELYQFRAGVYTPALMPHHSININAAVQYQEPQMMNFYNKELYPRGAESSSIAASKYLASRIDYQLPLAYPDWGLNSIVYFKRLRLGLNADFARFVEVNTSEWNNVWSYGATLYFDMHALRIPVNLTTFSVSVYKPSDNKGVVAGVNFSLPL